MGGKKRKIPIVKIEKKPVISVAFTKRRAGLFSKASELCLLSPNTQIAILATPPSSNSHASFYSFGHSSVDHVVSSLLRGQPPLSTNQFQNGGLGFWWEDQRFDRSENVDELREAANAVSRMLNNARLRLDAAVNTNQRDGALVIHQEEEEQVREPFNTTSNNNEETMNHVPNYEGGLVIHQEEEVRQHCNTDKNKLEERANQVPNFEGASGSGFGNLLEIGEDGMRIDDFFRDCNIYPLM